LANHSIETPSAQAIAHADVPKRTEAEWAEIIRDDLGRAVEGIIAAGEHLQQAKYQHRGRFLALLKSIGLHERTAERLMKIAANVVLANPTHGSKLPTSMRSLYELSTLPVKLLEAKIGDGTITPDIERKDVEQLKRVVDRHKPHRDKPTKPAKPQRGAKPKRKPPPPPASPAPSQRDDVGATSSSELARKDAQLEDLQNAKRRLEIENIGLRSEVEDLKTAAAPRPPGPRPPANAMLLKLAALIAGGGEAMELFIRELLITGAKAIGQDDANIGHARKVLAAFAERRNGQ
jgi:hypothetical protein